MFNQTHWVDEYKDPSTGEVIQKGTDQSAGNFNAMENGIQDVSIALAALMIGLDQQQVENEVEELTVALTNSEKYPFNNSEKSIAMQKACVSKAYLVDVELVSHVGDVGDIIISDKLLNGFKVRFDGSAKSATVTLRIKGGH